MDIRVIEVNELNSEVIWSPQWPQRPRQLMLKVICTWISGYLRSPSSNPRSNLTFEATTIDARPSKGPLPSCFDYRVRQVVVHLGSVDNNLGSSPGLLGQ